MTRFGQGVAGLLALGVFALAAMVRIVPADHARPAAAPVPVAPTAPAADAAYAIPVRGVGPGQLSDTWGQSRQGGARVHQAIDIIAARGTPVIAAMPGRVEKLFVSQRGGLAAYVRSPDSRWQAYYAHLAGYAPGLAEGMAVRRGQLIGFVGDTGNAGRGNYHLHFALARMAPGDPWYGGTPVNPYPLLAGQAARR